MKAEVVLLIAGIFVLALVIGALSRRRDPAHAFLRRWPFYSRKLLSRPEQVLYFRLVNALPECLVLAQVQMSRLLDVKKGNNFQYWRNRINRLSLDFVVCLKDSSVVAVIELDDPSHEDAARQEADARKTKALADAGVPLIRWNVASIPDETTIREAIGANGTTSRRPARQV